MTVTETITKYVPTLDKLVGFMQGNLDALVHSNGALVSGLQAISQELLAQTQTAVDAVSTRGKQVFAVKSVKEALSVGGETVKATYQGQIANVSKISEMTVKVASDVAAPVTGRIEALFKTAA